MKHTADYAATEADSVYVVDLYQNYRFDDRTDSGIQDPIGNSDGVVAIPDSKADEVAGFARTPTDHAFRTMIVDPVANTDSDNGGTELVSAIYSNLDLDDAVGAVLHRLKRWENKCSSWGFEHRIFGAA